MTSIIPESGSKMRKIILAGSLIMNLFLNCNSEIMQNEDFLLKISSGYFIYNYYVVIPVKLLNKSELIITEIWSVYDDIFRVYRPERYLSFSKFFIDLLNNKISVHLENYSIRYTKVVNTEISEEYSKNGITYILAEYFIEYGPNKFKYKSEYSSNQKSDLIRIMFENKFLIVEDDINACTLFAKYFGK